MTDIELVTGICERDEFILELLQKKYGTYCAGIAMKLLKNEQEVQEVLNDVWLLTWERIPVARPVNLKLYLSKMVRNTALHFIEHHNAQKRSGICLQLDELAECIPDRFSKDDVEILHLRDIMNRFLSELKPEYRQMFLRRYWYGDSIQELSQEFRCSESRVGVILFRCRRKLKDYLEKEEIWL